MKVALPVWQGQVSSVFDFAHKLLLIELKNGQEKARQNIALIEQSGPERAVMLKQLGVNVLICGAISRQLAEMLKGSGIQVLPFVTGPTEQIINAYKTERLSQPQYILPGFWRGARRGFRRCRGWKGGRIKKR
jgi:predicted Fe-Mo cluster-binding NifX family protein